MPRINVYDVPENTYETFKKIAARQQRTVTRQILWMIQQAVAQYEADDE
jgi:CopG-like RHH_1 or ribbon-helix-helix domain, RHH_5